MLKEIQDILIKAEADHPGLAIRFQVASTDCRVSVFGGGDATYHTAMKTELVDIASIQRMVDIAVTKVKP